MRSARLTKVVSILLILSLILSIYLLSTRSKKLKEFRFAPKQLLGYQFCVSTENKEKLPTFSIDYPCSFNPPVPSHEGLTVVTFVNKGWINMTKNWICSAQKVGLGQNLFLITLEVGVCSHFPGIPCYHDSTVGVKSGDFGQPNYQKFMIQRTKLVLQLLSCNTKRLLLADADVVFLQNPITALEFELGENDIVLQRDSTGVKIIDKLAYNLFNYICGGFIYMKINNSTKLLYQSVLQYQMYQSWNDQAGLNVCIRHHTLGIKWTLLSLPHFPNGKEYFDFGSNASKAVIVHANFKSGAEKIVSMILRDIWCYQDVVKSLCIDYWTIECMALVETPEWCDEFGEVCKTKYGVKLKTKLYLN